MHPLVFVLWLAAAVLFAVIVIFRAVPATRLAAAGLCLTVAGLIVQYGTEPVAHPFHF